MKIKIPHIQIVKSVIVVTGIAALLSTAAYAAVNVFSAQDAESGARSGNVALAADTSAAGGSAIKFGTAASACLTGALNAPGTADPWGGCWPGPNNTGVPAGTTLTTSIPEDMTSGPGWSWVWYTPSKHSDGGYVNIDSCSPTTPIVFDKTLINGAIWIQGGKNTGYHTPDHPCVKVTKSKIIGLVYTDWIDDGPIVLEDVEVDSGIGKMMFPNVGAYNIYAYRVNSHHGEGVIKCQGWCETKDNWIHDMIVEPASHMNAIGTNGLYSPLGEVWNIEHNYTQCGNWSYGDDSDSGGCSGSISLFPNFANIHDVRIYRNYLAPAQPYQGAPTQDIIVNPWHYWSQNAYCMYTANDTDTNEYRAQNVTIDSNIFGKGVSGMCGVYGPVASWAGDVRGNTFTSNKYDDGTTVSPN